MNKKYVLSNSESVQCNLFIFDHVTFIQFKICCGVQNFIRIVWFFTEIWRYIDFQNCGRPPSWNCFTTIRDHPRRRVEVGGLRLGVKVQGLRSGTRRVKVGGGVRTVIPLPLTWGVALTTLVTLPCDRVWSRYHVTVCGHTTTWPCDKLVNW